MRVRPATGGDAQSLLEIYNHYVRTSPATFDVEPHTIEARRGWIDGFDADGPYRLLVAEQGGVVAGYACSTRFKTRRAYDTSVETSVYLAPDATGRGIGRTLYDELLAQLVAMPALHRAYGGVSQPNPASDALHLACGYTVVGTYREVGFKFDRYWDVTWYERSLEPDDG